MYWCVVGDAGPSLLPPLPAQGFDVVVWEMAEEVGGTWLFSEAMTEGRGNLYRSLSTNLPKEIMQYCFSVASDGAMAD